MLPVAVDAMGGDHAPESVLEGARIAVEERNLSVVLVGRSAELNTDLDVIEASEVIAMDADPASSVRTMKDSSLVRAAEAVRDGAASSMVSAGNTGATMASALLRMGRIKGVKRPAIATPIPSPSGTPTVLLDAGANAECSAEMLVQFAQMGATYIRERFDIARPRVALLSIGEEAGKGNDLVKSAYRLFDDLDWSKIGSEFVGNVEGRDLMAEEADVVVTDGFTGNVALKSLEGAMKAFATGLFEALGSSPEAASAAEALGPSLDELISRFHPDTYGGAMLLGTRGVCIIGHGASTPIAIANAISVGAEMAEVGLVAKLGDSVTPIDSLSVET